MFNPFKVPVWTSLLFALPGSLALLFFYYPIKNVSLLVIGITFSLLFFITYQTIKTQTFKTIRNEGTQKWKRVATGLFLPFLSLWLLVGTKNEQTHLLDNAWPIIVFTYIGAFLSILLILFGILTLVLKLSLSKPVKRIEKKSMLLYAGIPMLVWFMYWIAFFPGGMTPDSFSHWHQINTGVFNDWHPFAYTMYMLLLTQLWDSPAIIGLSQIIGISLIIGYSMYRFEVAGIRKLVLLFMTLVIAIWPINGIYSITLWKDVYYAAFLLLLFVVILNIVVTKGQWITQKPNLLLSLFASLGVVFFRHNGFPVYVVVMVVLLIVYRQHWKKLALIFSITVGLHYFVSGPVFTMMNVTPSNPNEALGMPTQQMANIILFGEVTPEQKQYLNQILPIEKWKENYHPFLTDPIKFDDEYNSDIIMADKSNYFKTWLQLCLKNPELAIEAFLKQTSLVWQINEPAEPGYTSTYVTNIYYGNQYGIENQVLSQTITTNIQKYLTISNTTLKPLIWRPALYSFLILFFTFAAVIRKDWRFALPILPIALNTGTVFLGLPAQDFRYLYSNTLVTFFAVLLPFVQFIEDEEKR